MQMRLILNKPHRPTQAGQAWFLMDDTGQGPGLVEAGGSVSSLAGSTKRTRWRAQGKSWTVCGLACFRVTKGKPGVVLVGWNPLGLLYVVGGVRLWRKAQEVVGAVMVVELFDQLEMAVGRYISPAGCGVPIYSMPCIPLVCRALRGWCQPMAQRLDELGGIGVTYGQWTIGGSWFGQCAT